MVIEIKFHFVVSHVDHEKFLFPSMKIQFFWILKEQTAIKYQDKFERKPSSHTECLCDLNPFPTCALSEFKTLVHLRIIGIIGTYSPAHYRKNFIVNRCVLSEFLAPIHLRTIGEKLASIYLPRKGVM